MEIETVDDLAEKIADWLGIYGSCKSDGDTGCDFDKHDFDKSRPFCCRHGFVGEIKDRIYQAIENEKKLGIE